MKYQGKLYGKVGRTYIPLVLTAEDVDRLEYERDTFKAELELIREVLASPKEVHANTLRGTIAKLSDENVKHVYPHLFENDSDHPPSHDKQRP